RHASGQVRDLRRRLPHRGRGRRGGWRRNQRRQWRAGYPGGRGGDRGLPRLLEGRQVFLETEEEDDAGRGRRVAEGVGGETRQNASRPLIRPRPEKAAPEDGRETRHAVAMGRGEEGGRRRGRRPRPPPRAQRRTE